MFERKKMPKGWKSPFKVDLYQVVVERTEDGRVLPVGPMATKEVLGPFKDAIAQSIKTGMETRWSNPQMLLVKPS